MIKTNIKLQVTPEQSEAIQNICFANGVFWYAGNGSEVRYTKAKYLFIDSDRVWFRVITDHNIGTETEGYTEVDADLFIRTNGSCVEEKKEIDLRNTWCYATVPNHDKLRLMGYDHEPVGACKEYYYIDNDNKINDFKYYPDGNQIRLNNQGEFEYATLSSQQSKSECQFAKYGFEKPDFECELLKEFNGKVLGIVYSVDGPKKDAIAFWWDAKTGKTGQSNKYYTNMYNLTPIKKEWYETCKFPCIIMADDCMPVVVKHYEDGYVYDFRDNKYCVKSWRLLTNNEIEGLKQ